MTIRHNKRVIISIITALVLIASVGSYLAYAYFTATDKVDNDFSIADPEVTVIETPSGSDEYEWGTNTKKVSLKNTSENLDGYVRCSIFPLIKNSDGNIQNIATDAFDTAPSGNLVTYGDIVINLASNWDSYWVYGEDGYFYYKYELDEGKSTPNLVTGVTLASGTDESDYDGLTVEIQVLADIIQEEALVNGEWNAVTCTVSSHTLKKSV